MPSIACLIADYGLFIAAGLGVVGVCHAYLTQLSSKSRAAMMLSFWSVTVGTVFASIPHLTEACRAETAPPAIEAPAKP